MDSTTAKRIARLEAASTEALRFIERADAAVAALVAREGYVAGCPETAAAKRASMDLTRALAMMRRNPYNA